jgi:hypothetical protein
MSHDVLTSERPRFDPRVVGSQGRSARITSKSLRPYRNHVPTNYWYALVVI